MPWTPEYVTGMREELPDQFAAMVDVGAGLRMRQGEIFGFSPDDIDESIGMVKIQRQVKLVRGKFVFALPEGEKIREVPLAESVERALDAHEEQFPPIEVTLPWREPDGEEHTARLYFARPGGWPLFHDQVNEVWFAAAERVGIIPATPEGQKRPDSRRHGMHALKHYFASALLTEGEAIQAVSEWMGHDSIKTTLDIYAHLMKESETRMRRLIDKALAPVERAPGEGTSRAYAPGERGIAGNTGEPDSPAQSGSRRRVPGRPWCPRTTSTSPARAAKSHHHRDRDRHDHDEGHDEDRADDEPGVHLLGLLGRPLRGEVLELVGRPGRIIGLFRHADEGNGSVPPSSGPPPHPGKAR
ncbi:tyrosine-type recombinase/integrase [Spirillospora sp. CA-255316]